MLAELKRMRATGSKPKRGSIGGINAAGVFGEFGGNKGLIAGGAVIGVSGSVAGVVAVTGVAMIGSGMSGRSAPIANADG